MTARAHHEQVDSELCLLQQLLARLPLQQEPLGAKLGGQVRDRFIEALPHGFALGDPAKIGCADWTGRRGRRRKRFVHRHHPERCLRDLRKVACHLECGSRFG
jgi:hypothetical protein